MRTLLLCVAMLLAGQQDVCTDNCVGTIIAGRDTWVWEDPPPLAVPAKHPIDDIAFNREDARLPSCSKGEYWITRLPDKQMVVCDNGKLTPLVDGKPYCENPDYFLLTNGRGESLCVDVKRLVGYVAEEK